MSERERSGEDVPDIHRPFAPAPGRTALGSRPVGSSGLRLPPVSLGLWWNFGDNIPFDDQRRLLRHAFDAGVFHFDLASDDGPPAGAAEVNFGRMMREDFAPYRDEIVVSTKAGDDPAPGPYREGGSRKHLLASAEQSLRRMSLDHLDVFFAHRVDPGTPIEETVGALDALVRQGKTLYVGLSDYSAERTAVAVAVARSLGTPLVIHQVGYSILDRAIDDGLTDVLRQERLGAIAYSPLAQGVLTDKYLGDGRAHRAQKRASLPAHALPHTAIAALRGLNIVAKERGQTLAQMAVQWVLREPTVASAIVGASRVEQLDDDLRALDGPAFDAEELERIDALAEAVDLDSWKGPARR